MKRNYKVKLIIFFYAGDILKLNLQIYGHVKIKESLNFTSHIRGIQSSRTLKLLNEDFI